MKEVLISVINGKIPVSSMSGIKTHLSPVVFIDFLLFYLSRICLLAADRQHDE